MAAEESDDEGEEWTRAAGKEKGRGQEGRPLRVTISIIGTKN